MNEFGPAACHANSAWQMRMMWGLQPAPATAQRTFVLLANARKGMSQPACQCHQVDTVLHRLHSKPLISALCKASVLQLSFQGDCGGKPWLLTSLMLCLHPHALLVLQVFKPYPTPTCLIFMGAGFRPPAVVSGMSWSAAARLATRCSCCARPGPSQPSQAPLMSLRRHSLLLSWTPRARPRGGQVRAWHT